MNAEGSESPTTPFRFHFESSEVVSAPAESLFDYLDDHRRIAAHMSNRSWMMAGGRVAVEIDAERGRAVGSAIRMHGRVLGFEIRLEEIVTEREPPILKTWQTTSAPHLLVIGPYRMGFRIEPRGPSSALTVFIAWTLPDGRTARWLGRSLGAVYARWCTRRMARDAADHFGEDRHGEAAAHRSRR